MSAGAELRVGPEFRQAPKSVLSTEPGSDHSCASRPPSLSDLFRVRLLGAAQSTLSCPECRSAPHRLWPALTVLLWSDRLCEVRALARGRSGDTPPDLLVRAASARAAALLGDIATGVAELEAVTGPGRLPVGGAVALGWLAEALTAAGEPERANRVLGRGLGATTAPFPRAVLLTARGSAASATGDLPRSLADHLASGRMLRQTTVTNPAAVAWRSRGALVAAALGRGDLAAALAEDELAAARQWGAAGAVGRALHARAVARHDDSAPESLDRAAELLRVAGLRGDLVAVLCDCAVMCAAGGDPGRGRRAVAAAEAAAAGDPVLADRVRSAARVVGGDPGGPALTRQELRIAQLARLGDSNRVIAETLFLTVRTVEFHLSNVYRKLGISGRRELAVTLPSASPH
ncbi:LuxR C-terminal-related transcriptional regulator [Nocardia sp. NPDC057227]|uniref:helix-turn-helix transcriptional regulator n=1 Tax=Nocardia sp. NPDC057227 TaxID=3346056 RepID=UPI00363AEE2F